MASTLPVVVTIEPLVGFERVQKVAPTPHTQGRLMYGVRVSAGIPRVSLEGELTKASDREDFPLQGQTIQDTDERLKLGLRSRVNEGSLFSVFLRAGGQATRNTHEVTQSGATSKTIGKIAYDPYAGLGLGVSLASYFELDGGITAVFNQFPDMSKNDYQATLGFTIRYP